MRFWRDWLGRARIPDHRWRDPIQRSALAIKGLTYMPTGATVAALTTSLPETPGGERNWDYRYTWMRDTTFTLQALHYLNLDWEADEFMQFVADLEPNEDGSLQIMYGIDGRRDLTESTLDDLTGYAGARPVRIGNGAFDQRQNDVFGAVLDSILLHTRRSERLPRRLWPIVQAQAECATQVWREPDQGIWEARGAPQHYVSSKLMCWVALDRAAKLAEIRGDPELQATWSATAEEIRADILEHGVSDRGVLRQHYETDALDASTLLAAIFGFLPGDDERLHATGARDRGRADRGRLRPALPHRRDRRRPLRQGGHVPHLLLLARLRARDRRRGAARARPDGAAAADRLAARALRGGVRRRDGPPPRQLPAGVLAPGADRGGRRGSSSPRCWRRSRRRTRWTLRRDHHRHRRGRRHARPPPRAVRQAHPAARARRLAAARAAELVGPGRVRRQPLRLAGHLVRRERQAVPAAESTTSSAARRSSTARRSTGFARRTSASCSTTTASRRPGRSPTTSSSRTTRWPSSSTRCTARAARTRPSRRRARRTRIPPCRTSRGSSSSPTTSRPPATTRSTRRAGSCSTSRTCRSATCIRCATCDGFPCLVHAKSDAEVLGVRPALEHPNVTLLTNAKVVRLETNGEGTAVTEVVVDRDGRGGAVHGRRRRRRLRRGQHGEAAPAVGERQAPERARERLRSGRPQLHVPRLDGRARALARGEPDRVPEDARAQRLLLRRRRLRVPARQHPDGRQVAGADVPRRAAAGDEARARVDARADGKHAIDFWLSTEDLPRPDNRVTVDGDGNITLTYTETNLEPKKRLYDEAQVDARRARHEPGPPHPPLRVHEERHPGRRLRAPGGHLPASAPTRRRRCSTSNCKAHELDNLYVVDTSVFPSIGAVNPALTAMANSLRVGDHLLERLA